jgi:hypothetical protein
MTYRADLDALVARHATLQAEIARKQRELAEVAGMIAETRQLEQAESYFAHAPDLRRRQLRHLAAGVLAVTMISGAAIGSAATDEDSLPTVGEAVQAAVARVDAIQARREAWHRLAAEVEALRVCGLMPVVAANKDGAATAQRPRPQTAWVLGSNVPARGKLWSGVQVAASLAREYER